MGKPRSAKHQPRRQEMKPIMTVQEETKGKSKLSGERTKNKTHKKRGKKVVSRHKEGG